MDPGRARQGRKKLAPAGPCATAATEARMRSMTLSNWYTGDSTYDTLLGSALIFAVGVFIISWFFPSPYGRFGSQKYGVSVGPRLGWFLMELPSTLSFLWFYTHGPRRAEV